MSDYPASLQELISASQEADLKQAEERWLREKALHEEAKAKARKPNEISYNKLLQLLYGDEIPAPAPAAGPKPKPEKKDERPVEAFPPPPTGRR